MPRGISVHPDPTDFRTQGIFFTFYGERATTPLTLTTHTTLVETHIHYSHNTLAHL